MYWECSECGGELKRRRPPVVRPCCGLAGVVFMPAGAGEDSEHELRGASLRDVWFRAGVEAAASRGEHRSA
jgi:hypothetical protein